MTGGPIAPLPQGFMPQSEDAAEVYARAYSSFIPLLQEYMARTALMQQPKLITNPSDRGAGMALRYNTQDDRWAPFSKIIASGPDRGTRRDVAKHELGHYLVENLFAGAPPGTTDSVLDRLAEVGKNSFGFNEAVERAYRGGVGGASGVTSLRGDARAVTGLSQPPVFSYESLQEPVPPPLHEYLASQFFSPDAPMPSTGRDKTGRKWDANSLLESLALYQMRGP